MNPELERRNTIVSSNHLSVRGPLNHVNRGDNSPPPNLPNIDRDPNDKNSDNEHMDRSLESHQRGFESNMLDDNMIMSAHPSTMAVI